MQISELKQDANQCIEQFSQLNLENGQPREQDVLSIQKKVNGLVKAIELHHVSYEDLFENEIREISSKLQPIAEKLNEYVKSHFDAPSSEVNNPINLLFQGLSQKVELDKEGEKIPVRSRAQALTELAEKADQKLAALESKLKESSERKLTIGKILAGIAVAGLPIWIGGEFIALIVFPPLGWTLFVIGLLMMPGFGFPALYFLNEGNHEENQVEGFWKPSDRDWDVTYHEQKPCKVYGEGGLGIKGKRELLKDPEFIAFAEKREVMSEDIHNFLLDDSFIRLFKFTQHLKENKKRLIELEQEGSKAIDRFRSKQEEVQYRKDFVLLAEKEISKLQGDL